MAYSTVMEWGDVHPKVAQRILRHPGIAMPMEVHAKASEEAVRAAIGKLYTQETQEARTLVRASQLLCTRQDSNLQPSDP